jgi:hypothetical protein
MCPFTKCVNLRAFGFSRDSSLEIIESGAFSYCYKLAFEFLPFKLKTIEVCAFFNCYNTKNIMNLNKFDPTLNIMDGVFYGAGIDEEKRKGLKKILTEKKIEFGKKVFFSQGKNLPYPDFK